MEPFARFWSYAVPLLITVSLGAPVLAQGSGQQFPPFSINQGTSLSVALVPRPKLVTPKVRGFADLHGHQFGNLGFGGRAMHGSPFGNAAAALNYCDAQQEHGRDGNNDLIGSAIRDTVYIRPKFLGLTLPNILPAHNTGGRVGSANSGYPEFAAWPRWDSINHQQVWEQWLKRAFDGGLRLMVMHAVNNEHFCRYSNRDPNRTCSDQEAISFQVAGALAMEADLDARSGGPGMGWYRIVRSPTEARAAITKNQLAVVLGAEVDDAFPCGNSNCEPQVLAQLDAYYAQGIRHLHPIHFRDNSVGGAAFYNSLMIDRSLVPLFPPEREFARKILQPYEVDIRDCAEYRRTTNSNGTMGQCNKLGLNPVGTLVIRGMIAKGMIIDVDHMSDRAFNDTMNITEANKYPVVAGHAGFTEISLPTDKKEDDRDNEGNLTRARLERIARSGGMVGIVTGQGRLDETATFVGGPVTIPHNCGWSSESFAQAYLYAMVRAPGMKIGFGTDMNTFFMQPSPRQGGESCFFGLSGRSGVAPVNGINYPFTAVATGVSLNRSLAVEGDPSVTRTFNFNTDGLAHIGMLPDMIEDLRILGLRPVDLEPLMQSAEGYIEVWERAEANRRPEREQCVKLRTDISKIDAQLARTRATLAGFTEAQQACQAAGGKPDECVNAEEAAARRQLTAEIKKLATSRLPIIASKSTNVCWF